MTVLIMSISGISIRQTTDHIPNKEK